MNVRGFDQTLSSLVQHCRNPVLMVSCEHVWLTLSTLCWKPGCWVKREELPHNMGGILDHRDYTENKIK